MAFYLLSMIQDYKSIYKHYEKWTYKNNTNKLFSQENEKRGGQKRGVQGTGLALLVAYIPSV